MLDGAMAAVRRASSVVSGSIAGLWKATSVSTLRTVTPCRAQVPHTCATASAAPQITVDAGDALMAATTSARPSRRRRPRRSAAGPGPSPWSPGTRRNPRARWHATAAPSVRSSNSSAASTRGDLLPPSVRSPRRASRRGPRAPRRVRPARRTSAPAHLVGAAQATWRPAPRLVELSSAEKTGSTSPMTAAKVGSSRKQLLAHACPLRSVPGEHHGTVRRVGYHGAGDDRREADPTGEGVPAGKGRSSRWSATTAALAGFVLGVFTGVAATRSRGFVAAAKVRHQRPRLGAQPMPGRRRHQKRRQPRCSAVSMIECDTTGWADTSRNSRCPSSVAAATASAKRTRPRRLATQSRPRRCGRHPQPAGLPVHRAGQGAHTGGRRDHLVLQRQRGLDQPDDARPTLQMTRVGFDRSNPAGFPLATPIDGRQCAQFHRVYPAPNGRSMWVALPNNPCAMAPILA